MLLHEQQSDEIEKQNNLKRQPDIGLPFFVVIPSQQDCSILSGACGKLPGCWVGKQSKSRTACADSASSRFKRLNGIAFNRLNAGSLRCTAYMASVDEAGMEVE